MEGADPENPLNTPEAPTAAERRILERCTQIALSTLAGALKAALEKADEDFFQLAQKATERTMEQLHLDAMALVRQRGEEIERRFREHLHEGMQAALLPRRRSRATPSGGEPELEFSLVDPDDLEESIASQEMASRMKNACTEELGGLERRIGELLHDPELKRFGNPFDPTVLAEAFMSACRDTEAPLKMRLLLVTMWDRHMQDAVLATYREINQYLIEKGILPRIRHEIRRAGARAAEIAALAAQAAVEAVQAVDGEGDVFAAMQRWFAVAAQRGTLPHGGVPVGGGVPAAAAGFAPAATAGVPGAGVAAGGIPALQNPAILAELTALQHGEGGEHVPALAQAALATAPIAILRDIRENVLADKLGHADAMTIEVVAMLFDFIFEDRRVPDALKALIGRLQIPVLKAAMLDPAFFSKKTHPTRRLLNLLGEAANGWEGELTHEHALYRKVEAVVQAILERFEDDLAVFEAAIEDFQRFLDEQEREADALVAAAAPLIVAREQDEMALEEAREAAEQAVRSRARDAEIPEAVRKLLCETWTEVLTRAYRQSGPEGAAWKDAMGTMDDLIWSTRPKHSREEREQLIKILPSLLRRLKAGMEAVGTPQPVREAFMGQLVKCHAAAVSTASAEAPAAPARESAVVLRFPRPDPAAEPVKLGIITPGGQEGQVEVEEITISPVGWADDGEFGDAAPGDAPAPAADADAAREAVAALKPGMWVEFRHSGMEPLQARLKWISPLKGTYLFCDRQGKRGATMPREKLEAAFRIGTARLIGEAPLSDRAVENVLETLRQAAA